MTAMEFISTLEGVRPRGAGKWSARCPHHPDKSPSLTIREGDKALLVKCWAGCSLEEVTRALGLTVSDLFFNALSADLDERRIATRQRAQRKTAERAADEARGRAGDALREAEHLIQSAQGISIAEWSDDDLHAALERMGAAYQLLESEAV